MIVVDSLLLGGLRFVLDKVATAVDAELNDEGRLREELLALQMRYELGEVGDEEYAATERDLLARGIFTSIPDLARKIRRYITRYNEDPKPIRWTYSNPAHRITTRSADTVH